MIRSFECGMLFMKSLVSVVLEKGIFERLGQLLFKSRVFLGYEYM